MPSDKQPKQTLKELAWELFQKDKTPSVNDLIVLSGRIIDGERDEIASGMVAQFGTPQMMLALHEVGAADETAWKKWKGRMTKADADLVLAEEGAWPHEVREWATVVLVSDL